MAAAAIKKNNLPRGVRKVDTQLGGHDFEVLQSTIASIQKALLLEALLNCVILYRSLRQDLFPRNVNPNQADDAVTTYLEKQQLE